eukprot:scaffold90616_cov90-Phaeocystis_antarctica.AAC.1
MRAPDEGFLLPRRAESFCFEPVFLFIAAGLQRQQRHWWDRRSVAQAVAGCSGAAATASASALSRGRCGARQGG